MAIETDAFHAGEQRVEDAQQEVAAARLLAALDEAVPAQPADRHIGEFFRERRAADQLARGVAVAAQFARARRARCLDRPGPGQPANAAWPGNPGDAPQACAVCAPAFLLADAELPEDLP
ncbi:hypothetical protein [Streptomyces europaeiscabiei]|uniref:hypothetical protein n=1 Tax=Streptomyces europaeiscabiei TaxID=146819 RepID=UPI0038F6DB8C